MGPSTVERQKLFIKTHFAYWQNISKVSGFIDRNVDFHAERSKKKMKRKNFFVSVTLYYLFVIAIFAIF